MAPAGNPADFQGLIECYTPSRARDGGGPNEHACWVLRPKGHVAALCDGAGHAQRCAGGSQTTFVGIAAPRDVVLLMSDDAWTPVSASAVQRVVMAQTIQHFSDLPVALFDLAGKHGRIDDMSVVALRIRCPGGNPALR